VKPRSPPEPLAEIGKIMKITIVGSIIVAIIGLGLMVSKINEGFWGVPVKIKQIYYSIKCQNIDRFEQTIDNNFKINTINYMAEYQLKSTLNVPHIIYVSFNANRKLVPSSYKFKGKISISAIKDGKSIYEGIDNIKVITAPSDDGKTFYTTGFYLTKLPFPIANRTYDNIKIRAIVKEIDDFLVPYINSATISIYPDIVMDSNAPR